MKHHPSRRGVALLATVATLAAGSLTTYAGAASAADAPRQPEGQRLLVLDLLLQPILDQVLGSTLAQVQNLIDGLSPTQVGDLLQAANETQLGNLVPAAQNTGQLTGALTALAPTQAGDLLAPLTDANLSALLSVLDTTQLASILATLTSGELSSVVDGLTAGQTADLLDLADAAQLTSLLAALDVAQLGGALGLLDPTTLTQIVGGQTPAQIAGLLGAGAGAAVLDGLLGTATGLGATPGPAQVNGLVGQVTALLGGGATGLGDGDVASLLGILDPLLATAGLDSGLLSSLLATVSGVIGLAPPALAAPLQSIVETITTVLNPATPGGGSTTPGASTAPAGATTPNPGATTTRPATALRPSAPPPAAASKPGPYRATISAVKVSKRRTRMTFTLSCPKSAPKGCLVQLSAKIAGQKAIRTTTVALSNGRSSAVTVTLSKSTTKRLKKKGGSLTVTARTALSTLGAATQTVKVKRPKTRPKAAQR